MLLNFGRFEHVLYLHGLNSFPACFAETKGDKRTSHLNSSLLCNHYYEIYFIHLSHFAHFAHAAHICLGKFLKHRFNLDNLVSTNGTLLRKSLLCFTHTGK